MRVLRHAAATQPARAAAFSHDGGLQRLVELACSCDQGSGPRKTNGSGAGGADQVTMGAVALDVLRALCEEKDSKALLAPRLAKLLQVSGMVVLLASAMPGCNFMLATSNTTHGCMAASLHQQ